MPIPTQDPDSHLHNVRCSLFCVQRFEARGTCLTDICGNVDWLIDWLIGV